MIAFGVFQTDMQSACTLLKFTRLLIYIDGQHPLDN